MPSGHPHLFMWAILHETSFFPSYGLADLKEILREKKIQAYLITGRYSFLRKSLYRWLKYRGIYDLFDEICISDKNEQPHMYKERMIRKLKLDMYIEDNWDIVRYLNSKLTEKPQIEIHWVYNILERNTPYPHKHPHMKGFVDTLTKRKLL